MASPVWKGTLSFGLVRIPVRMYAVTERHGLTLHQFERGTSDRVRYRRVNERTGEEVPLRDIVKGAQVDDDEDGYVLLEPGELEEIAPGRTHALEITEFVPSGSVEPLYYDRTYYLAPDEKTAAEPYRLLCAALERAGRLGIASLVLRDRQHIAVIGPQNGVITLSTLWWADEVRAPEDVLPSIPEADLQWRDLDLAEQLIGSMARDWDPESYTDDYQERLAELVHAKHDGTRVKQAGQGAPGKADVVELTDALRASLHGGRSSKSGHTAEPGTDGRTGPAEVDQDPQEPSRLAEMSKKNLIRLARSLGIAGRSKMTRAELEKAIARTEKSVGSRSA